MRRGYVYIVASRKNGTIYIGMTSDLPARIEQHRAKAGSKFAARYGVMRLVWFDEFERITDAIQREKTVKEWPRRWKINLIERANPHWHDLRHQLHTL
ncbi:MAG: GIY-YIG nuclease family protein [Pseudomonadota bacterium]